MPIFRTWCCLLSLQEPSETTRTLIVLSCLVSVLNPQAGIPLLALHDVWQLTSLREPPSCHLVHPEPFGSPLPEPKVEVESWNWYHFVSHLFTTQLFRGPWRAIRVPVGPPDAIMSKFVCLQISLPFSFLLPTKSLLPAPTELTHHSKTCPASHWLFPCTPCLLSSTHS